MKSRTIAVVMLALLGAPVLANDTGRQLFEDSCSGCHQANGEGSSGLAPAVANPDLFGALGDNAQSYLAGVIMGGLSGKIVSRGEDFVGLAMPPHTWLTDEEAQAIADYVLNDLNRMSINVPLDAIVDARAAPPAHSALRAIRNEVYP